MGIINLITTMVNQDTESGETRVVTGQFSQNGEFKELTNTLVHSGGAIVSSYQPKLISEVLPSEPEDSEGSKKKK